MGLDWNPLGKPKPEVEDVFLATLGELTQEDQWPSGTPIPFTTPVEGSVRDAAAARFRETLITPYETLDPPRVGRDATADAWIRTKYADAPNKPATIEEWVRSFDGYWVLDLLPESDGFPIYSNAPLGGVERFSFRGKFLDGCEEVIGENLFEEAFLNHLPEQLAEYGTRLMAKATALAEVHDLRAVLTARDAGPEPDPASPRDLARWQAHIVASAARWAAFWSSRGHGLEADW